MNPAQPVRAEALPPGQQVQLVRQVMCPRAAVRDEGAAEAGLWHEWGVIARLSHGTAAILATVWMAAEHPE